MKRSVHWVKLVESKIFNDYQRADLVAHLVEAIQRIATKRHVLMEMCGGQTHALVQYGLDQLLRDEVEFVHGPGCPVCVTPQEKIDQAIQLARQPEILLATYGDMLRVPGTEGNLFAERAKGADVRIVYSALDAVRFAQKYPDRQVVFFGIGFETTAPANAMSVIHAKKEEIPNYSMLVSQVCVPPALEMILSSPSNCVTGFLAAGHVCAVMGTSEYIPLAQKYRTPIVVAGFEPVDLLMAVYRAVEMLENAEFGVRNAYPRVVKDDGNPDALRLIDEAFVLCDSVWRGIGLIPASGWTLNVDYEQFDAEKRFSLSSVRNAVDTMSVCMAGEILKGVRQPFDCPAFGTMCTPEHPLGAVMVSGEGACAAYYRYRRMER